MYAVSRNTFVLDGIVYFRMRFELDADGNPERIVGIYEDGREDSSERDR